MCRIIAEDPSIKIVRDLTTDLVSDDPFIINWKVEYHVVENGNETRYQDEMHHRAFSRNEISKLLSTNRFTVKEQGIILMTRVFIPWH